MAMLSRYELGAKQAPAYSRGQCTILNVARGRETPIRELAETMRAIVAPEKSSPAEASRAPASRATGGRRTACSVRSSRNGSRRIFPPRLARPSVNGRHSQRSAVRRSLIRHPHSSSLIGGVQLGPDNATVGTPSDRYRKCLRWIIVFAPFASVPRQTTACQNRIMRHSVPPQFTGAATGSITAS